MTTVIQGVNDSTRQISSIRSRHEVAIREAGKADRLNFTDAIKRFIEYVDREGEGSSLPNLAYVNMTKTVYAAFGLNKKQREALEIGEKPRDTFDLLELRFLQMAESAAAVIINAGIEENATRKQIKSMIRTECAQIASSHRRLGGNLFKGGEK
ncbi:hypothetical protein [Agrobacterium sp. SUL3]|uniref:hypothetical protein n=1 Tax=Agrobacterium sp. SUL3 TaxID=1701910 RepID=UPI0006A4E0FA|nr:hypothetical protein [Agrobacterium sp. SUL3]KNY36102.1 hypothetical protein AKG12_03690 [Agrobacterium sp. SUL3]